MAVEKKRWYETVESSESIISGMNNNKNARYKKTRFMWTPSVYQCVQCSVVMVFSKLKKNGSFAARENMKYFAMFMMKFYFILIRDSQMKKVIVSKFNENENWKFSIIRQK